MPQIETRRTFEQPQANPEIFIPIHFASDFAKTAGQANRRVWVQCMDFEMGHPEGLIVNALQQAGKRGLDAKLTIDQFAVSMINDKPARARKKGLDKTMQEVIQQADKDVFEGNSQNVEKPSGKFVRRALFKKGLAADGVDVTITNPKMGIFFPANLIPASIFPVVGRNHMKIHIIDDIAYFGGVNISSDHFEKADFMVKIADPKVVNALADVYMMVNGNRPGKDLKIEAGPEYTVLVDRGMPMSSIISREIHDLILSAGKNIKYVSQFPPSGKVLDDLITQAKLGVQVDILTQSARHFESNSIPFGMLMKRSYNLLQKRMNEAEGRMRLFHFEGHMGKVHAKMISIDDSTALWGSHNLNDSGVRVGTQEASIITSNKQLVGGLINIFNAMRSGTYDLGYQPGFLNPQGRTE